MLNQLGTSINRMIWSAGGSVHDGGA
jgi:hypothetical protein